MRTILGGRRGVLGGWWMPVDGMSMSRLVGWESWGTLVVEMENRDGLIRTRDVVWTQ